MRTSGRTACATIILSIAIVSSAAGQSANEAAPPAPAATNEQSPNAPQSAPWSGPAHDFAFDAVRGLRRCEGQILTGAAT